MVRTLKASIVALLLVAVVFMLLPAKPASAQALQPLQAHHSAHSSQMGDKIVCTGDNSSCNGVMPLDAVDPTGANCYWKPYAVESKTITVSDGQATVQLYYSPNCHTNWAHLVPTTSISWNPGIVNANITRQDGLHYNNTQYLDNLEGAGWLDSPMVYAPVETANACGSANNLPGGCTGYM